MVELISKSQFIQATQLAKWNLGGVAGPLMQLTGLKRLNQLYGNVQQHQGRDFLDAFIRQMEVEIEFSGKGLEKIPSQAPFITISNHPFGLLDGIVLLRLFTEKRPDFKTMANYLLRHVEPVKDMFIDHELFEKPAHPINIKGLRAAIKHLEAGHPLGIFPAGEVSTFQPQTRRVTDKVWNKSAIKLIRKARVPVIPVYFEGSTSLWFHLMGIVHPSLRTEVFKKKKSKLKVIVGSPISVKEMDSIEGIDRLGRYLRARTYLLSNPIKVKPFFQPGFSLPKVQQPIADPIPAHLIKTEIEALPPDCLICQQQHFQVYLASAAQIPNGLQELGRLREEMFREVGEGTGFSIDTDEYDLYYRHLFLWDTEKEQIAGAYRMGLGREIMDMYGKKGFYLSSLFKIQKPFQPWLEKGVELGRSFVKNEYQRQRLPLYLLWKGIHTWLEQNPHYQYLLGPVSISNSYTQLSRDLIVALIKTYYYDEELATFISPKKQFRPKIKKVEVSSLVEGISGDLSIADRILAEIEPQHLRLPVLLKKYIKQNARIIGFNVDPKFSDSLDGLIVLDLTNVPDETKTLMK